MALITTRCRVPKDLESVTSIRTDLETPPREVGIDPKSIGLVWSAVRRLYQSGIHPAIQLCVRRHGQVIIDRAIGHASGNGPNDKPDTKKTLATPATPFTIFSASKAITAMAIHLLDQERLVHLNDPVCEYIPEFGVHKKQWITIQHVLNHRAGIPNLPPEVMQLDRLADREGLVQILCEAKPTSRPGRRIAYHAISGGFVLGELVHRVTGKELRTYLENAIWKPLGFRWMRHGVRRRDTKRVAQNYFTGPPPLPPISTLIERALGIGFKEVTALSNDPRFFTGVIPSANVVATANELSRFYQLLLDGGELDGIRIFEPRTIRRATTEQSYLEFDLTLGLPLRYGLGFMLGGKTVSLYGPDTHDTFGHVGFTNVISWADPKRQVAATLMTSGKPLLYPAVYYLYDVLRQIGAACDGSAKPQGRKKSTGGASAPNAKLRKSRKRRASAADQP